MTEQERQQQAGLMIQVALEEMARQYGFKLEPVMQAEAVTESYVNMKATLALRPIPGWREETIRKEPQAGSQP